jgi:hypothetical protein
VNHELSRGGANRRGVGPPEETCPLTPADVIINEIMDMEDEGELTAARARLREAARCDSELPDRHAQTRRVAGMLRDAPDVPDFSIRVLAAVDAQRPYLPRRGGSRYDAGRLAVAACAVLAVGVLITIRPGTEQGNTSQVATQTDANGLGAYQADALGSVRAAGGWGALDYRERAAAPTSKTLSIGSTRAYDTADWDTSLRLGGGSSLDTFMPPAAGLDSPSRVAASSEPMPLTLLGATAPSARVSSRSMSLEELAQLWSARGDRSRMMGGNWVSGMGDSAEKKMGEIRFDEPWWENVLLRARSRPLPASGGK